MNKSNLYFEILVFADARQKVEDPIGRYFTESNLYRFWSFIALPVTLPIDLTYAITKRYVISVLNNFDIYISDERLLINIDILEC